MQAVLWLAQNTGDATVYETTMLLLLLLFKFHATPYNCSLLKR